MPKLIKMKKNAATLGEAIDDLISSLELNDEQMAYQIEKNWEKLMGKMIANRTKNIFLKESTLFIFVSSAPLKNDLFIMRHSVVERLNELFGKEVIRDVIIR